MGQRIERMKRRRFADSKINRVSFTSNLTSPHPIPLPQGERGTSQRMKG
jgi:hypothetical protein